jgi:hypothetical protein
MAQRVKKGKEATQNPIFSLPISLVFVRFLSASVLARLKRDFRR